MVFYQSLGIDCVQCVQSVEGSLVFCVFPVGFLLGNLPEELFSHLNMGSVTKGGSGHGTHVVKDVFTSLF